MSGLRQGFSQRVNGAIEALRLFRLRDDASERRFDAIRGRYAEVVRRAAADAPARSDGEPVYAWGAWASEIFETFRKGVPRAFLRQPRVRRTMVFDSVGQLRERIDAVQNAFGTQQARQLLREDAIGRPRIVETSVFTSPNRAHHGYHLANYSSRTSRDLWACASFLEWGGGYGDMARIVRRLARGATYSIIDLAPVLALQYVYLSSLEGEEACRIVTAGSPEIVAGKINFIESGLVTRGLVKPAAEMFLSTWAATESPPDAQAFIVRQSFFGASRLLLAYLKDESNRMLDAVAQAGCRRFRVTALQHEGYGDQHEYAFR